MSLVPFRRAKKRPTTIPARVLRPKRSRSQRSEIELAFKQLPKAEQDALTASGERVQSQGASYLRRLIMPWQIRSFGYYDMVGEFKFAAEYYARSLGQLRLFAAELDGDGEVQETANEDVKQALARIRDPGGSGRSMLQAQYGRLMFLTGEGLLLVWDNPETKMEQWELLSTDELRILDGSITRFMAPSLPATQFQFAPEDAFEDVPDTEAQVYRLHKRHPRFSALSDATSEGVLDILEELVLLTQVVRARVRSRLAGSGILFLDDRITTKPQEAAPDEDPYEDPFIEDLTEAMMSPIVDEGTASAVVPLIVRITVPEGMKLTDVVYHLQMVDPLQIYPETGLRTECIRRLAMALDMPAEALLGYSDTNHWNAWIIDETAWKAHIRPIADGLVQDLTSAYLLPYLREQNVADWSKYLIAYDPASVINHPNQSKDVITLHDKGIVGDDTVIEVLGFTEKDKATKEEQQRAIGVLTRDSSLAWDGVPSVRAGGVEVSPGEIVSAKGDAGPTPTDVPAPGDTTPRDAPAAPAAKTGQPDAVIAMGIAMQASRIEGAAQLALMRTRQAAGSRLMTWARRDDEAQAAIRGIATYDIPAALGRPKVKQLLGSRSETELTGGTRDLIVDAMRVFGVEDEAVLTAVADTIEAYAARTLYEAKPQPLPPNFTGYVQGLLATK